MSSCGLIKRIKNNKITTDVWCGIELAPGAYYQIQESENFDFATSEKVETDVENGDLIMNDGNNDLSVDEGIRFLGLTLFNSVINLSFLSEGETDPGHKHYLFISMSEANALLMGEVSNIVKRSTYESAHYHDVTIIWDNNNLGFIATAISSNHGHTYRSLSDPALTIPRSDVTVCEISNGRCRIYRSPTIYNTSNITIKSGSEMLVL